MMKIKERELILPTIKETLAEKMYIKLYENCNGNFDFEDDEVREEFIRAFKSVLYEYSLVPTASIIE